MSAGQGPAPQPHSIVLIGFMGAGKSTVGRILAARLGWRFYDIDSHIVAQQQQSIANIFALHGEPHFRALELEAIRTALDQADTVVALGGGAIETAEVRDLLFPETHVTRAVTIFLEAPLADLLARCATHPESPVRPLLAAAEAPADRLARRLPYYRRAHLTIETSGRTPVNVVEQILLRLPPEIRLSSTNGAAQ